MATAVPQSPYPGARLKGTFPPYSPDTRDPHTIPDFNNDLLSPDPLLYLPPFLSSLPGHLSWASASGNPQLQPVFTETCLPDIDPASLSLHKALHHFKPLTPNYSDTPYAEAFNWSDLSLPVEEEREWYCVVFRSKRKAGSDGICKHAAFFFPASSKIPNLPSSSLRRRQISARRSDPQRRGTISHMWFLPFPTNLLSS